MAATGGGTSAWDDALSVSGRPHFRHDIEGLRAVAIAAVVLYHANAPLPGGFVGVDVFFVISGFLITGLLLRELETTQRVDLIGFYARRARRLLPAALVVIVVTTLVALLVVSRLQFRDIAADGAAGALYMSNYRFALNATDYLAENESPSPFLHYWSLAAEEQFYLFWPLLMLGAFRLAGLGRLWLIIGLVGLGSFALSAYLTDVSPPWAFFSLPTRAWELGLGALIAVALSMSRRRWPAGVASLLGLGGLGMVAASAVVFDQSTQFPGFAALLPTLGAGLIIVGGEERSSLVARLLASAPARFIGRISYSLYLWHWPMLLLGPMILGRNDPLTMSALVVATVVVASLSTRFIEDPFRAGRAGRERPRLTLAVAGALSLVIAVMAVGGGEIVARGPAPVGQLPVVPTMTAGPSTPDAATSESPEGTSALETPRVTPVTTLAPPSLPPSVDSGPLPANITPALADAREDVARSIRDGCQVGYEGTGARACRYGLQDGSDTVIIFGDSHAAQWLPAIEVLAAERDWRILSLTKASCPAADVAVYLGYFGRAYRECDEWRNAALEAIAEERPQIVFVSFSRAYAIVQGDERIPVSEAPGEWQVAISRVLGRLTTVSERVVLLGDTPRHATNPADCLAEEPLIEACIPDRAAAVDAAYELVESLAARDAGAELISATEWLCPGTICPLVMGSYLVYRDTNHVTATFMTVMAARLGWELDN